MINYIKGVLVDKSVTKAVIETNGIGFELNISENTFSNLPCIGDKYKMPTYLQVKEDEFVLFGFSSLNEKEMFLKLITISGVGPKLAQTVISGLSVSDLVNAILDENIKLISKIKGVGSKTAERIVLELKDKVINLSYSQLEEKSGSSIMIQEAVSALESLGVSQYIALKSAKEFSSQCNTTEELVSMVLKGMAKNGR